MEQLIEAFGIDVRLITIQIINFAILLAALSYFLYKPVLKLLAEREATIKQGIDDAEAAARSKAEADSDRQVIVSAAHQEAAEINSRAKVAADDKSAVILADAEAKKAAVLKEAERKGEEMKIQARKDSEAEIAKLAILAAEKVLREKIS